MHEMSIASTLLETLLDAAASHGGGRPVRAELRLGTHGCIHPDALRFGFEALSRGTRAEGCSLDLEMVPASGICRGCGWSGPVADPGAPPCPSCGDGPVELHGGREITLVRATLDDP